MSRFLKSESGYSLVEVMASIMILTVAIIPMVVMFDMGLNAATAGGNYDKARTLANQRLETAKSLSYQQVGENFPEISPTTTTYNGSGYYESAYKAGSTVSADFSEFEYKVEKQYLAQPTVTPSSSSESFAISSTDQGLIKVTVTVRWDTSKTYSTSSVFGKGAS